LKLLSYRSAGRTSFGVVSSESVIDLAPIAGEVGETLREALERDAILRIAEWASSQQPSVAIDDVEFLPVVPDPRKILCIGINYRSHVEETGRDIPTHPMTFTRFADSQTGHLQPLIRPKVSTKFDFEGELAVVIGKFARHVKADRGLEHVAGYSCYNDGSVRDWQRTTAQFTPEELSPDRRLRSLAGNHRRDTGSLEARANDAS
jgi:2-keto-4-pentenoate hydratase/2-oxohepta-3-ene-1,7-dioic acid hydratase in catechol pathway